MAEDRDALLQHYRETREDLLSAIKGISDELMVERSLDGWSVKDHLAHLALWDDVRASEVARISAGHDSAWRMNGDQDEAYRHITEGHPERAISVAEVEEAMTDPRRIEATVQRPDGKYGTILGRTAVGRILFVAYVDRHGGRYPVHARQAGRKLARRDDTGE